MITTPFKLEKVYSVKTLVKIFVSLSLLLFLTVSGLNARNYIWIGAGSDNLWSNPDNWEFGNGDDVLASDLPMGTGDDAFINMIGAGIPQLTANETIGSLTITTDGLDLNSFTLSAGSLAISTGSISDGDFIISGTADITGGTFTFVNISAGTWADLTGTLFLGATTITKTGTSNDGNAVYNNTFGGSFTFNQTSGAGGNIRFGIPSLNTYIGDVTFNNNVSGGSSLVTISEANVSVFSGDLTVANGSTGGVEIGNSAGGPISVGNFSFSSTAGPVIIRNINESGSAGSISITGGTTLSISDGNFNGNITADVSGFCEITDADFNGTGPHSVAGGEIDQVSNCLFGGDVTFENDMAGNCPWSGGNTFQGNAIFTKTIANSGNWRLDASNANSYSGSVTINNAGTGLFQFAEQGATFLDDLTITGPAQTTGGVVTMAGTTGAQSLTGADDGWIFPTLAVTNTMGVNIDFTFNITSALNLSGVLELTSDKVAILGGSATFTGDEDGYVSGGAVQKLGNTATNSSPAFIFHVGADGFYAPFEYTTSNSGGSPEVTVQYTRPGPGPSSPPFPLELVSQTEQWLLTVDDTQIGNTVITLPYGVQSGVIGDEADLRVAFSADGGSSWTNLAGSAGSGEIIGNAQTFSAGSSYIVTLASIDAVQTPLPVELVYFEAEAKEKAVQLRWATASEINNDYFQVERSADGVQFDPIGAPIEGAGTTTEPLNYEYTDINPLSGISYYRLKQVDFGGQSAYSKVAPVRVGGAANNQMLIYPNPVQGQLQVIWGGDQDIERIRLLDAKGQELSIDAIIDNKQAKVELQALTPGVYFLELLSGQERKIEKIVIQ